MNMAQTETVETTTDKVVVLNMSEALKRAGFSVGYGAEGSQKKLASIGIHPMCHVKGMEKGETVYRPLYLESLLTKVVADRAVAPIAGQGETNRIDRLEEKVDRLLAALGEKT